ncbi:hypothetical protein BDQ17DRAFT_1356725 [Cyathus striatus]|nr:hypothetical protein BDQ17DRAFT_1356725 [Cyathus striatus]
MPPPVFLLGLIADILHDIRAENGFGCLSGIKILSTIQCILLLDVQKDLRRRKDMKKGTTISDASLKERFKWGLDLFFSPRGVGWTHEPTSRLRWIPSQLSASKSRFILHQLWRIAIFSFLYEIFKLYSALNPYLHRDGPSFYEASWGWRMTILTSRIVTHAILSIVFIVLGVSGPRDWPTMFQTYGKFVSGNLLGLPSDSSITTYVELYTAFVLSGIIHTAGDYRSYAIIITIEDGACWVARYLGFRRTTWWLQYLGYAWTLPIWMEPMVRTGTVEFLPEEAILIGPYYYLRDTFTSLFTL